MYYYHRHGAVSSIFRTMIIIFSILVNIKKGNSIKKGQLPVMGWSGYNAFMQNSGITGNCPFLILMEKNNF